MGMYDYLNGEQVKVFYSPIFILEGFGDNKPTINHSGGSLRSFTVGDELPIETSYYIYPKDFIIFDYRFSEEEMKEYSDIEANVMVIKNKFLKAVKWDNKLSLRDIGSKVVDNYGRTLNVHSLEDFALIKKDFRDLEAKRISEEEELFPNGMFYTLENNYEEYMSKRDELNEIRDNTIGEFNRRWINFNENYLEKKFGEYLESITFLGLSMADPNPEKDIDGHKKSLKACVNEIKLLIEKDADIVSKYVKWQNKDEVTSHLVLSSIKLAEKFMSETFSLEDLNI